MPTLYETIGVPKTASIEEIAKAYRTQSLKYHPDRNPTGSEHFKVLTAAYEILKDSEKRAIYDATGALETDEGTFSKPTLSEEDMDTALNEFYGSYRGSEEEEADIIESYKATKGNFAKMVTEHLIFQNVKGEVDRLKEMAAKLIEKGLLKTTDAWNRTSDTTTLRKIKNRMKREREQAAEALEEMKANKQAGGTTRASSSEKKGSMDELRALIIGGQNARRDAFNAQMEDMERRYAGKKHSRK